MWMGLAAAIGFGFFAFVFWFMPKSNLAQSMLGTMLRARHLETGDGEWYVWLIRIASTTALIITVLYSLLF
jgi:hypothetical protein